MKFKKEIATVCAVFVVVLFATIGTYWVVVDEKISVDCGENQTIRVHSSTTYGKVPVKNYQNMCLEVRDGKQYLYIPDSVE